MRLILVSFTFVSYLIEEYPRIVCPEREARCLLDLLSFLIAYFTKSFLSPGVLLSFIE